jgi:hypothetical protein
MDGSIRMSVVITAVVFQRSPVSRRIVDQREEVLVLPKKAGSQPRNAAPTSTSLETLDSATAPHESDT